MTDIPDLLGLVFSGVCFAVVILWFTIGVWMRGE